MFMLPDQRENLIEEIFLASMKTLTYSKDCSESCIIISESVPASSHLKISLLKGLSGQIGSARVVTMDGPK